MAKKKITHQPKDPKQKAPHQPPICKANAKKIAMDEASKKLMTLKSLNMRLVKDIVEMRQYIDSLVRDKEVILEEKGSAVEALKREKVLVERKFVELEGLTNNLKIEIEQIVKEKNVIASLKSALEVQNSVLKNEVHKKNYLWTFITASTTILAATCVAYFAKRR